MTRGNNQRGGRGSHPSPARGGRGGVRGFVDGRGRGRGGGRGRGRGGRGRGEHDPYADELDFSVNWISHGVSTQLCRI
jgi:hypothetical protein